MSANVSARIAAPHDLHHRLPAAMRAHTRRRPEAAATTSGATTRGEVAEHASGSRRRPVEAAEEKQTRTSRHHAGRRIVVILTTVKAGVIDMDGKNHRHGNGRHRDGAGAETRTMRARSALRADTQDPGTGARGLGHIPARGQDRAAVTGDAVPVVLVAGR